MGDVDVSQHSYVETTGWIIAGIILLLTTLAMKYPNRTIFTEDRNIPTFDSLPLIGVTLNLLKKKDTCHQYMGDQLEKLDVMTVTGVGAGIPRSILTIDPRNVDHILKKNFENYIKGPMLNDVSGDLFGMGIFNANGEIWKTQRKTAMTILTTNNFRDQFTSVMLHQIHYMSRCIFDNAAKNGQPLDFYDIMLKFTLDSSMSISFGVELGVLSNDHQIPFATSFDVCQINVLQRCVNPFYRWTEFLGGWLMPWKTSIQQHLDIINDFIYSAIDNHQKELEHGEKHGDLLSRFMAVTDEKGQKLNKKELRDVVLNFVIAGRDTTAQAISWMLYLILMNPAVEKKLMMEIEAHITEDLENNSADMYDTIKKMKYAHATLYETLRLYPGVPGNQKYALEDDIWPDGTLIKKKDYVLWSAYAQGRSEKIWGHDAKEFKPERWITAEGNLRQESPTKWSAFNAGPRSCIGQKLATLEALMAVTSLLRQYEFTLLPKQEITYQPSMTLPMKYGMYVYVKHRTYGYPT